MDLPPMKDADAPARLFLFILREIREGLDLEERKRLAESIRRVLVEEEDSPGTGDLPIA